MKLFFYLFEQLCCMVDREKMQHKVTENGIVFFGGLIKYVDLL